MQPNSTDSRDRETARVMIEILPDDMRMNWLETLKSLQAIIETALSAARREGEAEAPLKNKSAWDRLSVSCDNCSAQILARGGTLGEHHGVTEPCGELETLCGYCAGKEIESLIKRLEDAERKARAFGNTKPVGWVYKIIVNKHITGPPLEGQIQIESVWGTPSDHVYFSIDDPTSHRWVYWKAQVYSCDESAAKEPK